MKKIFISLLTIVTFLITSCSKHEEHNGGSMPSSENKVVKYICPMHPQIFSDKPGKCSICGMDLVDANPESEEEHEEHDHEKVLKQESEPKLLNSTDHKMQPEDRSEVKLSLDKQQIIGVKTEIVIKRNLFETIRAPGRIAFDPELYTAESEYLEALRQQRKVRNSPLKEIKRSTREMVRSSRTRLKVLGLGDEEIKEIRRKGKVSEGLIVSGNNDNLIYADIFESNLFKIKKGQSVKIKASFISGDPLKGEVVSIDQLIDPKTRTARVRIKIVKTDLSIRPEAFVTVEIAISLGKHVAVPTEAIFDTGKDMFVFIKKGRGIFEPRIISRVFETDDFVAILKGVKAGDEVVTSANFMIDSESRLKAVIKKVGNNSTGHNH